MVAGWQLNFPGVNISDSTMPPNIYYIRGTEIPADGMLGVFLFEDGEVNAWHNGEFANSVRGGQPGRVFRGWSAPQMRNFGTQRGGFRVTDVNGSLIDTRISAKRSQFTIAYVARTHAKHGTPHPYNLIHIFSSDTANAIPATNAGNLNLIGPTSIWGIGATLNDTKIGQFIRYGTALATGAATFTEMANSLGVQNQWNAFAMSVNGPAGTIRFQTLTDYRVISDSEQGNTEIYDTFVTNLDQRDGTFLLGATPNGPGRDSSGPLADVMAGAFSEFAESASDIEVILRGLAKVAADRGVAVAGY